MNEFRPSSRDEDPLDTDQHDTDSIDIEPCPFCGKSISAQADVCPKCHNFILHELDTRVNPVWRWVSLALIVLTVLGLVVWRL